MKKQLTLTIEVETDHDMDDAVDAVLTDLGASRESHPTKPDTLFYAVKVVRTEKCAASDVLDHLDVLAESARSAALGSGKSSSAFEALAIAEAANRMRSFVEKKKMTEEEKPQAQPEERKPFVLPRKTPEELAQFITDFLANKILTSEQIQVHDIGHVFMTIGLGALATLTDDEAEQIGLVYEYYTNAGPISCDGLPVFLSAKMLHVDDWKIARSKILEEQKRRDAAKAELVKELEKTQCDPSPDKS